MILNVKKIIYLIVIIPHVVDGFKVNKYYDFCIENICQKIVEMNPVISCKPVENFCVNIGKSHKV
jgi:hypothetical protein